MINKLAASAVLFCSILSLPASAAYKVSKATDGGFTFEISGIKLNEGSSLQRETILLNNAASSVEITSSSLRYSYKDRSFSHSGNTKLQLKKNIKAIQIRHALYDVFGKHVVNLSNAEPKDLTPGEHILTASWRAPEAHLNSVLTNVTYVARVRFEDGSQWVANWDEVVNELARLQLEKLADPKDLDK